MSDYKVVRDKLVKHQGVLIDSRTDGSVHIQIAGKAIDLEEAELLTVYVLLSDITEWAPKSAEAEATHGE